MGRVTRNKETKGNKGARNSTRRMLQRDSGSVIRAARRRVIGSKRMNAEFTSGLGPR